MGLPRVYTSSPHPHSSGFYDNRAAPPLPWRDSRALMTFQRMSRLELKQWLVAMVSQLLKGAEGQGIP